MNVKMREKKREREREKEREKESKEKEKSKLMGRVELKSCCMMPFENYCVYIQRPLDIKWQV